MLDYTYVGVALALKWNPVVMAQLGVNFCFIMFEQQGSVRHMYIHSCLHSHAIA